MLSMAVMGVQSVRRLMARLWRGERGMTMIEYGVMAGFLVLIVSAAVIFVGPNIREWFIHSICSILGDANCKGTRPTN